MKYKKRKLEFSIEFIESLPKTIDPIIGCWLYLGHINPVSKYGLIKINYKPYPVHRLSASVYHNQNYYNDWFACHIKECPNKHCFNPTHLYIGDHNSNMQDMIDLGKHKEQQKLICPKCGGKYSLITIKSGSSKGRIIRVCRPCKSDSHRDWARNKKRKYQK